MKKRLDQPEHTPDSDLVERGRHIQAILIECYGRPGWGAQTAPLDELVSTILSQNTNDLNRDRAYLALRAKYPSWEEVRDAPEENIIDAIRPAGLAPKKGPRIQSILRQITEERGDLNLDFLRGIPPDEARAWLIKFNGVGPKTVAIVMQFSLDTPAFPVDTHIYRVTGRLGLRPVKMSREKAHDWLSAVFDPQVYGPAHLNLIRLGRETCHPHNPSCTMCPVKKHCDYFAEIGGLNAEIESIQHL
jgi:endonuclease-3